MNKLRLITLCFFVLLLLISGLAFWNAGKLPGVRLGSLQNMLPANVDMRISDFFLDQVSEEGRDLAIKATTAHFYKDEEYFLLNDVEADVNSLEGLYRVTADLGRYEPGNNAIRLTGKVRTVDRLGRILTSQRMDLDMANGIFASLERFCLEDPGMSLSGKSFVYDLRRGLMEAEGRIFMQISQGL
jgi:LPS export ABC transporter protein LptC